MSALLLAIILATSPNQGGGRIALTDEPCTDTTFIAISFVDNGDTISGCWLAQQELVFVKWDDGTLKTYPADSFTLTKEAQGGR
jgi:hypothetical protein